VEEGPGTTGQSGDTFALRTWLLEKKYWPICGGPGLGVCFCGGFGGV